MAGIKDFNSKASIKYNSIELNDSGKAHADYSFVGTEFTLAGRHVYDDADRAVLYVSYVLDLTTTVYSTTAALSDAKILGDGSKAGIASQLSVSGKTLELTGVGIGKIKTSRGGNTPDIIWGAKPRIISFAPIGGQIAWQLHWIVEFNVAPCVLSASSGEPLIAVTYSPSYSIDDGGFTTRSISGFYRVAQYGPNLSSRADLHRERIDIVVPKYFRRISQNWTESADRTRVNFSIVDTELKHDAFPRGIESMAINVGLASGGAAIGAKANYSVSGSITVANGYSPIMAGKKFFEIAFDRIRKLRRAGATTIIPRSLSMSRTIGTRTSTFAMSWLVAHSVTELLMDGGHWMPAPESKYDQWAKGMETLWTPRGGADLAPTDKDDLVVISVCNPADKKKIEDTQKKKAESTDRFAFFIGCGDISPKSSYLAYSTKVTLVELDYSFLIRFSRAAKDVATGIYNHFTADSGITPVGGRGATESASEPTHEVEKSGPPLRFVMIQGKALRVKWPAVVARVKKVGGLNVTPHGKLIREDEVAFCFFGCPVYATRWYQLYVIDGGSIRDYKPPKNPVLCDSSGPDNGNL